MNFLTGVLLVILCLFVNTNIVGLFDADSFKAQTSPSLEVKYLTD